MFFPVVAFPDVISVLQFLLPYLQTGGKAKIGSKLLLESDSLNVTKV